MKCGDGMSRARSTGVECIDVHDLHTVTGGKDLHPVVPLSKGPTLPEWVPPTYRMICTVTPGRYPAGRYPIRKCTMTTKPNDAEVLI